MRDELGSRSDYLDHHLYAGIALCVEDTVISQRLCKPMLQMPEQRRRLRPGIWQKGSRRSSTRDAAGIDWESLTRHS